MVRVLRAESGALNRYVDMSRAVAGTVSVERRKRVEDRDAIGSVKEAHSVGELRVRAYRDLELEEQHG